MIKLETCRLIIRDYVAADLEDFHRLISDKENMSLVDGVFSNSVEETRENLENAMRNEDGHYFVICDKESCAFIGSVGYTYTEGPAPDEKTAHLGYFILPEYHGKGFTTEAVKKVLEFAFDSDGCAGITTGCHISHIASARVMEKAGFRKVSETEDRLEYVIEA